MCKNTCERHLQQIILSIDNEKHLVYENTLKSQQTVQNAKDKNENMSSHRLDDELGQSNNLQHFRIQYLVLRFVIKDITKNIDKQPKSELYQVKFRKVPECRRFCPCGVGLCHPANTQMHSPTQKLAKPSRDFSEGSIAQARLTINSTTALHCPALKDEGQG